MANLVIFKNSFVAGLRGAVPPNLRKYLKDQPWVLENTSASSRDLLTSLQLRNPLQLVDPVGEDLKDLENAIRVHKALPDLTPLQARDPRLWTRLTHVDLWAYMRKRWPLERYLPKGDEKAAGIILERYFVVQSQSRSLLRNGMARLWWTAKLSYDQDRDNPYELTKVLLSTLDITQQILERGLGRAREVAVGFLEFLLRNKEELLVGGNQNRTRIRELAKFLNLQGGICVLDCLSRSEIMALLQEELDRILEAEGSPQESSAK